jgi:hypothetical protein
MTYKAIRRGDAVIPEGFLRNGKRGGFFVLDPPFAPMGMIEAFRNVAVVIHEDHTTAYPATETGVITSPNRIWRIRTTSPVDLLSSMGYAAEVGSPIKVAEIEEEEKMHRESSCETYLNT